jgi:hypothetical protein
MSGTLIFLSAQNKQRLHFITDILSLIQRHRSLRSKVIGRCPYILSQIQRHRSKVIGQRSLSRHIVSKPIRHESPTGQLPLNVLGVKTIMFCIYKEGRVIVKRLLMWNTPP